MPSSTHSLKHRIITFCFWQEIILWDTLCSSTMYLFRSPGVRRVWERAYLVTAYSRSSVGDSNWSGYRAAVSFNPAQSHNLKLSPHVIPALDCASPTIFDQMDALNFLASMYFWKLYFFIYIYFTFEICNNPEIHFCEWCEVEVKIDFFLSWMSVWVGTNYWEKHLFSLHWDQVVTLSWTMQSNVQLTLKQLRIWKWD